MAKARPIPNRSPRPARLGGLALLAILLATPRPGLAAEGVKVDVEVEGLTAEMKRNVLGSIMLVGAAAEGRLSEGEARRLAARAQEEIRHALQPFGYYRPEIRAELATEGDPWNARYLVDRGPPLPLSAVDVQVTGPGAELPRFRALVGGFALKPGARLEHAPYDALRAALQQTAGQNGYLDAKFLKRQILVDLERYTARIDVHFETGERYFFGPVRFRQDVLDSAFVQSFVPFKTGEPYNVDSLIAMQSALGSSPYFSRVEVDPRRDEAVNLTVPIDVVLERSKRVRYTLGGGYGTDTGIQGEVTLEFRRLNRKGHRGEVNALVSELRTTGGAQYQVPRAFGRKQLLTYSFTLVDEETDVQTNRGGAAGVSLTRSRGQWHESFGLYLQRQTFTVGVDTGTPNLLFPELSWTRVRSDDRLHPRSGYRVVLLARGSSEDVLSDVTFLQVNLQSKGILEAGAKGRLIVRAETGASMSADFHELPPGMRYFAGGAQSVRAFGYQDLGPRDANGEPTGGARLLFGNVEYEQRVFGDWGATAFYDIGNAIDHFGDRLEDGAGVGLRWFSPVGMVRLDLAWPIAESAPGRVQFSIGPDL